jgi:hypothetical protein
MVNGQGLILHKTRHKGGRHYDYHLYKYHLYKHNRPVTPSQVENIVDLGYLGIQKGFPNVKSVLPVKKKKNLLLSSDEVIYNKRINLDLGS